MHDGESAAACPRTDLAMHAGPFTLALLELLETADAALERDQSVVKICLARAAALLREKADLAGRTLGCRVRTHGSLPRWQADRIVAYVDAHLDCPISSAELIALTSLSASHFFRSFKATFGQTPLAYIGSRRVERAKVLMLTSNEPLAQIALASGLCDQSHLNRLFRRRVGMSPWSWRRENARRCAGTSC